MTSNELLAIYSAVSAFVCLLVALVELLHRYSHAARASTILLNMPGAIYLFINLVVGVLAVLGAESAHVIVFDLTSAQVNVPDLFKSFGAGLVGLSLLRSSLISFRGEESDGSIGISALLEKIKEILDRKIDLAQKRIVDREVAGIMATVDANKARHELLPLCLSGMNAVSKSDILDMQKTINDIFSSDVVHGRAMMIGYALTKLCGVDALRAAVEQLGQKISIDPLGTSSNSTSDDINIALASELKRLKKVS